LLELELLPERVPEDFSVDDLEGATLLLAGALFRTGVELLLI
jgi:hypothetical protein